MKNINTGAEFLNLVFKDMKDNIKSDVSDPSQKIIEYLDRLEKSHKEALNNEDKKALLRTFYYDKYIIKKLPDSYIKYRKGYFYDLGLKDKKEITEQDKELVLECIKTEQKQSLDNLLEFLLSEQNPYPTWFKYYIFQGVTKIGTFYPFIGEFTKRSSSTTEPFISLDIDVIDEMYKLVSKYLSSENLSQEEQQVISNGLNFRNLYSTIYRKNNKNNMINEDYDEEMEEYIEPMLLYEDESEMPLKKDGKLCVVHKIPKNSETIGSSRKYK